MGRAGENTVPHSIFHLHPPPPRHVLERQRTAKYLPSSEPLSAPSLLSSETPPRIYTEAFHLTTHPSRLDPAPPRPQYIPGPLTLGTPDAHE